MLRQLTLEYRLLSACVIRGSCLHK